MKQSDAFPSEYLKAEEVSGTGENYTMTTVEMRDFEDPDTKVKESKPVLGFKETSKKLILNKTNWKRIVTQCGDDSDGWNGKTIMLRLESVDAFGKTVDVIRVAVK